MFSYGECHKQAVVSQFERRFDVVGLSICLYEWFAYRHHTYTRVELAHAPPHAPTRIRVIRWSSVVVPKLQAAGHPSMGYPRGGLGPPRRSAPGSSYSEIGYVGNIT